jgi:hypothetical protein
LPPGAPRVYPRRLAGVAPPLGLLALPIPRPLFQGKPRDNPAIRQAAESTYKFLDRVDDPVSARVRATLNAWFKRFEAHQDHAAVADLRGRLRAKQSLQFDAAFWELYLHELHARLGFEIAVHPAGSLTTHPNFLVSRGDERFYLEAVVPAPTAGMPSASAGSATVMDHVDAAYDADFFVAVRFATGGTLPRRRAVVAEVEAWLGSLAWSRWHDGERARYPLPETELTIAEWRIGLEAIPRSPAKRGDRNFPTVGIYPAFAAFEEPTMAAVVPTLDEKASKYGQLDAPHVIAAWVMSPLASEFSLPTALFGEAVPLAPGHHGVNLPDSDQRRGLWTLDRQRRDRPAALLVAGSWDFNFNAVARALPRLWHNPWAAQPLTVALPFATSRMTPDERSIENSAPTINPAELFELAADWPGTPFQRL